MKKALLKVTTVDGGVCHIEEITQDIMDALVQQGGGTIKAVTDGCIWVNGNVAVGKSVTLIGSNVSVGQGSNLTMQ